MTLKFLVFFCSLIIYPSVFFAQISAPKYSNDFMSIGVGARAFGMANTQVAHVNDVTAGYWNPAGLTQIKNDIQVAALHSEYFAGIGKYDYAGISKRIDSSSTFGFSAIRFGVDDIPNTINLIDKQGNVNYDRITTFSAVDYGFIFSYARDLKTTGLSFGANGKFIYRQIGDFAHAFGFGIDAGLQYRRAGWEWGLMARDISTTFNAWSFTLDEASKEVFIATGNELPENSIELTLPKIIVGGAKKFSIKEIGILAAVDLDISTDGRRSSLIRSELFSVDPHLGIEANYENTIFLRTGIGNIQRLELIPGIKETTFQPNLGLGIRIKKLYLDYALTDLGDNGAAPFSNVFSLRLELK